MTNQAALLTRMHFHGYSNYTIYEQEALGIKIDFNLLVSTLMAKCLQIQIRLLTLYFL